MSQDTVESILKITNRPMSAKEVSAILGEPHNTIQHNLKNLTRQGRVTCERRRGRNNHHVYYVRNNGQEM